MEINVCTYNLLAPCYKRLGEHKREHDDEKMMTQRMNDTFQLYHELNSSILCLQEYWFNEMFEASYKSQLASKYTFYSKKRTRSKVDGLAILVHQECPFDVVDQLDIEIPMAGDRVCMLLRMRMQSNNANEPPMEFLLANIHLTFPHNEFDYALRLKQVKHALAEIDKYIEKQQLDQNISILFAGDFNLDGEVDTDNVCSFLQSQGFSSSFYMANNTRPKVTHYTHRDSAYLVDFIWVRNNILKPLESFVHPKHMDTDKWYNEWTLSDHRPVVARFAIGGNASVVGNNRL